MRTALTVERTLGSRVIAQETENMQKMKPFLGPNGEMPEMDVMRAMGMDFKATNFDKDNPAIVV